MAIIKVEFNTEHMEIDIERRSDIKNDEDNQNILRRARSESAYIKCLCCDDEPLLTLSYVPKSATINILKRNPHYEHDPKCIFYKYTDDFYNYEKDCFTKKIFIEVPTNNSRGTPTADREAKEVAARYTYRHFCIDVLSEAISYAFNNTNKLEDGSENKNLIMYTINEYFRCLSSIISRKKLADESTPYMALPEHYILSVGIIEQNLNEIQNVLELREYRVAENNFMQVSVSITPERLDITRNLVNNHGNVLPGPYAYVAVYKRYFEQGELRRGIVRLYIYAIQTTDDRLCFVESGYERDYAAQLFQNNISFIKPVSGYEYKTLAKRFFPRGRPNLVFRPDFIEFYADRVKVVEVCGLENDNEYMELLQRKEAYYSSLPQIDYERVTP